MTVYAIILFYLIKTEYDQNGNKGCLILRNLTYTKRETDVEWES